MFDSDDIQNVNPTVDPIRDLEIIETRNVFSRIWNLFKKD
jgi:Predicted GTPase, probable translation factor